MTLKDTISKWHRAVCLLEQNLLEEAIQALKSIDNPSAKIVYNLGCIVMHQTMYTDAIEYFSSCIDKDNYLAIAYFQRGICYLKMKNYGHAEKDFAKAKSMTSEEGIDYRQLGADLILNNNMIDSYHGSCRHYANTTVPSQMVIPFMASIFHPPKKMVANLRKEDFLGKAKVISSVQESDIVYAEGKAQPDVLRKKNAPSSPRPAPRKEPSSKLVSSTLPPPSRPPPRMDRARSMGDLVGCDCDEEEKPLSTGTFASAVAEPDSLNKRQSLNDYSSSSGSSGYNQISQDQTDHGSEYDKLKVIKPGLSASSSALDRPNFKPVVPKRPMPRTQRETGQLPFKPTAPVQSLGRDFSKIQELLAKRLTPFEQRNDNNTASLPQKPQFDVEKQRVFQAINNHNSRQEVEVMERKGQRKPVLDHAPSNLSQLVAARRNNNSGSKGVPACHNQDRQIHCETLPLPVQHAPFPAAQKSSNVPPRPPKPPQPSKPLTLRPPPPRSGK